MNEQLKSLLALQEIEIRIDHLQESLDALTRRFDAIDGEVTSARKTLEDEKSALGDMRKAYRAMESDVQAVQSRLQKSEAALRSIKTNREYQSLLKEIDDHKNRVWSMEDAMLEHLEAIEKADEAMKGKEASCRRFEIQAQEEKAELALQREDMEKQLEGMQQNRREISERIPRDLADKYRLIKGRVGSMAVALVKDAVCRGCHLNIPPQMYNELQQRDDISYCPHCQRMIYWTKEETRFEAAPRRAKGA